MLAMKGRAVLFSMGGLIMFGILRTLPEFNAVKTPQWDRDFSRSNQVNNSQRNSFRQSLGAIKQNISVLVYSDDFPRSVYYFWCHPKQRYFEFRNYLSVMSVLQNFRPDSVIFFYQDHPVIDKNEYNTWLDNILFNTPSFQTRKAPAKACLPTGKVNRSFLDEFLNDHPGLYINEDTLVTSSSTSKLSEFCNLGKHSTAGPRLLCSPAESEQFVEWSSPTRSANQTELPFSIFIERSIFPKNIWTKNDVLSRASRKIFYGSEDVPRPTPSYSELAPNIAHMVWFGGGEMDFLFYLAVLSLLYVVDVEKVSVYGDHPPTGRYWSLLENETRVEHVYHEPMTMIYGKEIRSVQHMSDILRVELMLKYGGIYLDTDAVFVKPLDRRIRAYDAVATYDWWDVVHPFPEFINFGVSVGKKGARFWRLFQQTMQNFRDDAYILNGLQRPYKVMERHPDLIFIEPHLQLQCAELKCHPTWIEEFHNPENNHLNPSVKIDWRKDVYAYHWTTPTPKEFSSFQALMDASGVFAEIGQFVISKSGMMDYFLRNNGTKL